MIAIVHNESTDQRQAQLESLTRIRNQRLPIREPGDAPCQRNVEER